MARFGHGQVSVTTYHNDNGRTGQNLSEPYLLLSKVNSAKFGKIFSQPVDGFIYGQPLYVPGVTIPDKGVHNVVYAATEHDSIFAFDADTNTGVNSQPLWQVSFVNAAKGVTTANIHALLGCDDIVPEVGITSTPVIDQGTNTIYVVVKTQEGAALIQRLHALDLGTGAEKFGGPVSIQAQVAGTGVGSAQGVLYFDPLMENQRAGLLLQNGLLYIAWGSHCDVAPHHGWVMAYDSSTLAQVAVWASTANSWGGGVWQGGSALAADSANVYFATGNGKYSLNLGGSDAGDSVVKLSAPAGGALRIADYFTPHDQDVLARFDRDLGSGGVMLLPDQPPSAPHPHLLVSGSKEGTLYLVDRDNMGQYSAASNQNVQTLTSISTPIFNTAAWWNNHVYLGAGGKPLQALSFEPALGTLRAAPTSMSLNTFWGRSGTPSVSANGKINAIVWALDNGGAGIGRPAVLYAYDARNLGTLLYSSDQSSPRDTLGPAAKFSVPTICNGKVYVATASQLNVLGLLSTLSTVTGARQTGAAGSTLPVSLSVKAVDAYSGSPIAGVVMVFSDGGEHGTFGDPTPVTDSSGVASTTYTLPSRAQTVDITVNAPGFADLTLTETGVPGSPMHVVVGGGNKQTGPVSTALPNSLAAKVTDGHANPVPGVIVTFSDGDDGGVASPSQVATDSLGYARTIYTTPPSAGSVKVKASAANVKTPATFSVAVQ